MHLLLFKTTTRTPHNHAAGNLKTKNLFIERGFNWYYLMENYKKKVNQTI